MPASSRSTAPSSGAPSKKRKMGPSEKKYYAVRQGKEVGVYADWASCQRQISGHPGAIFKSFPTYEEALAFVNGYNAPSNKPIKYYGVAAGHKTGVFTDWGQVQQLITNFKLPKYKKFETQAEAEDFVRTYNSTEPKPEPVLPETYTVDDDDDDDDDEDDEDDDEDDDDDDPPPPKRVKTAPANLKKPLVVYTDGSSRGNGRKGATAGVGAYFGDDDPRNVSERLVGLPQTNQRAELTGLLRALEIVPLTQAVEIKTDSKYSIQCVTEWYVNWEKNNWMRYDKGVWKPVMNQDIIKAVRAKLEAREAMGTETQFTWVKGHGTDKGNIAADRLAVAGAMMAN